MECAFCIYTIEMLWTPGKYTYTFVLVYEDCACMFLVTQHYNNNKNNKQQYEHAVRVSTYLHCVKV